MVKWRWKCAKCGGLMKITKGVTLGGGIWSSPILSCLNHPCDNYISGSDNIKEVCWTVTDKQLFEVG